MNKGFTLVEFLIVVCIIAIIAAIAIPSIVKSNTVAMKKKYPELANSEATMIYEEDGYVVESFDDYKIKMNIKTRFRYMERDGKRMPLSSDDDDIEALENLKEEDRIRIEQERKRELKRQEKLEKDQLRIDQEEWDNKQKSF